MLLNTIQPKYEFVKNKTCPYCQSKIKSGSDFIVCSQCGTPHHKECWDENGGCTTYGCANNPNTGKKILLDSENVGNLTIESVRDSINRELLRPGAEENLIKCPHCKSDIEKNSVYCKFCGYNIKENKFDDAKKEFDKEYKKKYKDKIAVTRKRLLLTIFSVTLLVTALGFIFYSTITKINNYFSSDEYKIENTVYNWKDAWEDKNLEKYKSYLTDDYEYYGGDGKKVVYKDKLKRMESTFKNYKDIKITFSDFKIINDSSTTDNDKKVQFNENYESDKFSEKGLKTLRLYKGAETNNEWKIYREFFD